MTLSISILFFIDFVLLAGLIALWRRFHDSAHGEDDDRRIVEMSQLRDSLEKLLTESARVSEELGGAAEKNKRELSALLSRLDREAKILSGSLDRTMNRSLQQENELENETEGANDRYSDVVRLGKMGLSPDEISRKVGIPTGEIELVLSLSK